MRPTRNGLDAAMLPSCRGCKTRMRVALLSGSREDRPVFVSILNSAPRYRTLLLPAWLGLFAPVAASADIYIWTDERGTTVISDAPPANPKRVANLETVVKESERKTARPRTGPREP